MLSRLRKLIQTLLSHIVDNCVVFFRFPYDGAHRAVLAAVQHKQLVNGLSGTKASSTALRPSMVSSSYL